MAYVETSIIISGDIAEIYGLAKDMESYPAFMESVEYVKVIERRPNETITEWAAWLKGKLFKWRELDVFDDQKPGIHYSQVSGDLKKFEGDWIFDETPEGCKVTLTVDAELGIPMFAAMLNPVVKLVLKQNCAGMLKSMKERIEGRSK